MKQTLVITEPKALPKLNKATFLVFSFCPVETLKKKLLKFHTEVPKLGNRSIEKDYGVSVVWSGIEGNNVAIDPTYFRFGSTDQYRIGYVLDPSKIKHLGSPFEPYKRQPETLIKYFADQVWKNFWTPKVEILDGPNSQNIKGRGGRGFIPKNVTFVVQDGDKNPINGLIYHFEDFVSTNFQDSHSDEFLQDTKILLEKLTEHNDLNLYLYEAREKFSGQKSEFSDFEGEHLVRVLSNQKAIELLQTEGITPNKLYKAGTPLTEFVQTVSANPKQEAIDFIDQSNFMKAFRAADFAERLAMLNYSWAGGTENQFPAFDEVKEEFAQGDRGKSKLFSKVVKEMMLKEMEQSPAQNQPNFCQNYWQRHKQLKLDQDLEQNSYSEAQAQMRRLISGEMDKIEEKSPQVQEAINSINQSGLLEAFKKADFSGRLKMLNYSWGGRLVDFTNFETVKNQFAQGDGDKIILFGRVVKEMMLEEMQKSQDPHQQEFCQNYSKKHQELKLDENLVSDVYEQAREEMEKFISRIFSQLAPSASSSNASSSNASSSNEERLKLSQEVWDNAMRWNAISNELAAGTHHLSIQVSFSDKEKYVITRDTVYDFVPSSITLNGSPATNQEITILNRALLKAINRKTQQSAPPPQPQQSHQPAPSYEERILILSRDVWKTALIWNPELAKMTHPLDNYNFAEFSKNKYAVTTNAYSLMEKITVNGSPATSKQLQSLNSALLKAINRKTQQPAPPPPSQSQPQPKPQTQPQPQPQPQQTALDLQKKKLEQDLQAKSQNPEILSNLQTNAPADLTLDKFDDYLKSVTPIANEELKQLMREHIWNIMQNGTAVEKSVYKAQILEGLECSEISQITDSHINNLVLRLINKRPVAFYTDGDACQLRDGSYGNGLGSSQNRYNFANLGNLGEETGHFCFANYISYDEMKISAFLHLSADTFFLNKGDRDNKGIPGPNGEYVKDGVVIGSVGARFERKNLMEWQDMMFDTSKPDANYAQTPYHQERRKMWARFYGADEETFQTANHFLGKEQAEPLSPNLPYVDAVNERQKAANQMEISGTEFLDTKIYEKCLRYRLAGVLLEANRKAQEKGQKAYVVLTGLGLGVWQKSPQQGIIFYNVVVDLLKELDLPNISDVELSAIAGNESRHSQDQVMQIEGKEINLYNYHNYKKHPHYNVYSPLEASSNKLDKLLVFDFAWDGNSFGGNEYWVGAFSASGDPAAACAAPVVAYGFNEMVNPNLSKVQTKFVAKLPENQQKEVALDSPPLQQAEPAAQPDSAPLPPPPPPPLAEPVLPPEPDSPPQAEPAPHPAPAEPAPEPAKLEPTPPPTPKAEPVLPPEPKLDSAPPPPPEPAPHPAPAEPPPAPAKLEPTPPPTPPAEPAEPDSPPPATQPAPPPAEPVLPPEPDSPPQAEPETVKGGLVGKAMELKEILREKITAGDSMAPKSQANPARHPLALFKTDPETDPKTDEIKKQFDETARIVIDEKNLAILQKFYNERKKQNDKLGLLYSEYERDGDGFSKFILRLMNARYDMVYLDGRAVKPGFGSGDRKVSDVENIGEDTTNGVKFLEEIGTAQDTQNYYRQLLTLEEAALSHLILPQATSVLIGTSNRGKKWRAEEVKTEFEQSIDAAVISYPAACEFRNNQTRHYDLLFCVVCTNQTTGDQNPFAPERIAKLKQNKDLMDSQNDIFGSENAMKLYNGNGNFNGGDLSGNEDFLEVGKNLYLHKQAYKNRQKITLKALLLAADAQMAEHNLGEVFNLKGIGLGAFGIKQKNNDLEKITIEALKEILQDETFNLKHIKHINLINFPSTFNEKKPNKKLVRVDGFKGIKVTRCDMDPTSKEPLQDENGKEVVLDIGGTCACGDSGSKFGNEGNRGANRNSSDDPATQYSLANPFIFDPKQNQRLQNKESIMVLSNAKLIPFDKFPMPKISSPPPAIDDSQQKLAASLERQSAAIQELIVQNRELAKSIKGEIDAAKTQEIINQLPNFKNEIERKVEVRKSQLPALEELGAEAVAEITADLKKLQTLQNLSTDGQEANIKQSITEFVTATKTLENLNQWRAAPSAAPSDSVAISLGGNISIVAPPSTFTGFGEVGFSNPSNTARGNKMRVMTNIYKKDSAAEIDFDKIKNALSAVVILAADQLKIDQEEFERICEFARKNGGFSNRFEQSGETPAEGRNRKNSPEEKQAVDPKWRKFSKLVQEMNKQISIFSGRQENFNNPVGLRAVFALDILSDLQLDSKSAEVAQQEFQDLKTAIKNENAIKNEKSKELI